MPPGFCSSCMVMRMVWVPFVCGRGAGKVGPRIDGAGAGLCARGWLVGVGLVWRKVLGRRG